MRSVRLVDVPSGFKRGLKAAREAKFVKVNGKVLCQIEWENTYVSLDELKESAYSIKVEIKLAEC